MQPQFSQMPKKLSHHCPMCGEQLADGEIDILHSRDGEMMVYVTCNTCGVGMVAKLSVVPQGLVGLGILTDMSRDEVYSARLAKPVSAEEVLAMKILTDKGFLEIKV